MVKDFQMRSLASPPRSEDEIWERLQASLERLATAGKQNSDPQILAERLAARARTLRGRTAGATMAEPAIAVLGFRKGNQRFGIPLDDVLEVLQLDHFTYVPKAPPYLPGVVHWRGSILTLLDLGLLFGIPESGLSDVHVYLVIESAGRRIAIVGGELDEIYSIPTGQLKTPLHLPGDASPEWMIGVYDHNRLIVKMESILQDSKLANS